MTALLYPPRQPGEKDDRHPPVSIHDPEALRDLAAVPEDALETIKLLARCWALYSQNAHLNDATTKNDALTAANEAAAMVAYARTEGLRQIIGEAYLAGIHHNDLQKRLGVLGHRVAIEADPERRRVLEEEINRLISEVEDE